MPSIIPYQRLSLQKAIKKKLLSAVARAIPVCFRCSVVKSRQEASTKDNYFDIIVDEFLLNLTSPLSLPFVLDFNRIRSVIKAEGMFPCVKLAGDDD
jgi:hypothetical protein